MASPTFGTYGLMQLDERYKKLERTLKMLMNTRTDAGWPNVSSINGDQQDTSCAAMSHSSRLGSEVVASSSNMRNMLLQKSKFTNNNDNIVTSKTKLSTVTMNPDAKVLMPPPRSMGILAHSSRRNSLAGSSNPRLNMRIDSGIGHSYEVSSPSIISSIKSPSSGKNHFQIEFEKEAQATKNDLAAAEAPDRIFSKWRVMLNDKGQLIIKGTLQCGKVARSKPVIRRLTAISVQSIFNHIYNLQGNIYDERNELPEYIRGKFFNGFPDDWENVYQLWQTYVAGGCSLNFRWPTPITDSDDDLNSEMTEVTPRPIIAKHSRLRLNSIENRSHTMGSTKKSPIRRTPPEERLNQSHYPSPKASSIRNEPVRPAEEDTKLLEAEESSKLINASVEKVQKQFNTSTALSQSPKIGVASLKDILQEDKLNVVLETLASKNCSVEYIDKIIQMFDCYKYIMSYKSEAENNAESGKSKFEPNTPNNSMPQGDSISQKNSDAAKFEIVRSDIHSGPFDRAKEHRDQVYDHENTSTRVANESSISKRRYNVHRKLSRQRYESSESSESDSDSRRRTRSVRRVFKTREQRSTRRRSSVAERSPSQERPPRLKRRNSTRLKNINDSDDDYAPTKLKTPTLAQPKINHRMENVNMPPPRQQNSLNRRTSGLKDMEACARSFSHRQEHEDNSRLYQCRKREGSVSTITGFLATYESSANTTQRTSTSLHQIQNQHYDSSVSITEDEKGDVNPGFRNDMKRQILQEANARCLQEMLKRPPLAMKRNQERKIQETHGESQKLEELRLSTQSREQKEFIRDKRTEGMPLNDDKENRTNNNEDQIKNSLTRTKSRELEINKQKITEQQRSQSISPEKKKKPPIVTNVEVLSVDLKSQLLSQKSTSLAAENQSHDSSNKKSEGNEVPLEGRSKSFEDTKKAEKISVKSPRIREKKSEALIKGKKLTVQLEDKVKVPENDKHPAELKDDTTKKGVFGSESNPKRLIAWVPKVLQKSDSNYGLIFEGKLLNEAGHVVHRRFATDLISKRITPTIIETESHEFYQLVGDLCDTKHTVPKELQKQCFNKCPGRISNFCEKWKKLESKDPNTTREALNASMNIESMPTSSRGRRIVPALCYWTGERVLMKDNQAVYNPGSSQDSLNFSSFDASRKETSQNSSKRKDTSTKDSTANSAKNLSKPIEKPLSNQESHTNNKTIKKRSPAETANRRRSQHPNTVKRRLEKELLSSSSDTSDHKPSRSRSKRRRNVADYAEPENETKTRRPTRSNRTNRNPKEIIVEYKKVPYQDNDLSDDVDSHV